MNQAALAAVDWGTSSFRLWLLDGKGAVVAERRGTEGMLVAGAEGFPAILERYLADAGAPAGLRVIICGMAGARQGWVEAPYVAVPASLDALLAGSVSVPGIARKVRILPGLAQRSDEAPDVMRGEETQLAGILPLFSSGSHLVCMPGTHSKWVAARDGAIESFGTWLTGELFSLLSSQSILRHSLDGAPPAPGHDDPAFLAACTRALVDGGDVGSGLFRIRAATLLQNLKPAEAAATLSGLLIGAEVASAQRIFDPRPAEVILVASGRLSLLYGAALRQAGFTVIQADAEEAVRTGLFEAARQLGWVGRAA